MYVTFWPRCDICLSCSIFVLHLCTSYCLLSYSRVHFFNSNDINISSAINYYVSFSYVFD